MLLSRTSQFVTLMVSELSWTDEAIIYTGLELLTTALNMSKTEEEQRSKSKNRRANEEEFKNEEDEELKLVHADDAR